MRPAGLGQWPSLLSVDPLSFSTSAAYFQAHFRRLSEQYCFKSPELTATNIRVQNSLFMLPVREDRRMCQHNIEAR